MRDAAFDEELLQAVRPPGWVNPAPASRYHLAVVGAGTAGLVCAAGAAGLGARVALVERHRMGGDCLNYGCVPSKAIIRSSRVVGDLGAGPALGMAVEVDDFLRTSNGRVYAAGDVCLPFKFTHTADATARIVVENALFFGRRRVSALAVPWCTYTDPEVAHVGLTAQDAEARGVAVETYTIPFDTVDRAITDGEEGGFVSIRVKKGSDRIVGATIVARHAGEMINEVTLAMTAGLGLGSLGGVIHPHPTQAEAIRKAADAYRRTRLRPRVKRLLETYFRWIS